MDLKLIQTNPYYTRQGIALVDPESDKLIEELRAEAHLGSETDLEGHGIGVYLL